MSAAGGDEGREVVFSGRVQGVGFRYTVLRIAAGVEVTGYVRNRPDGRVELNVEGPPEEIDRLIGEITGHFSGYITRTQQQRRPAAGQFRSFEIRY